jgi:tetratricopeptide (TPR) repeat protein
MELTIDQALQQGIDSHKEGKIREAEHLYRAVLKSQPTHPDANHNLGLIAVSVNKAGVALSLFKTALESNPKIEQFWLSYIDALIKEEQLETARQVLADGKKAGIVGEKFNHLEEKLDNSLNHPSQKQLISLSEHYQAGRYDAAEQLGISLTHEFPEHPFGWKALGAVFEQTGRKAEALVASQKSAELSPKDAEIHSNLGNILQELGRLDEAEKSFRDAIFLKLDFAEAHFNLGNTLNELGRLDEAEASFIQAIALKPDYAKAHGNLGNILQELGRLAEAETSYRKAIELKPDYAEAHYNLANTLQKFCRLEEARVSYEEAIDLRNGFSKALVGLGNVLMIKGQHKQGLKNLRIGNGSIFFDVNNGVTIK